MSFNSQWDCLSFDSLDLGYNLSERELSEKPRLVAGSKNTIVTYGGKLGKRYGAVGLANTTLASTKRIDRLWVYETLDTPPIVYLVASVFTPGSPGSWSLYYCRLDTSTPWTQVTDYRNCNESTVAHEGGVARGMLFVRGVPQSGADKLGTVILDGSGGTMSVRPWGVLGSDTPAQIVAVQTTLATALNASGGSTMTLVSYPAHFPTGGSFNVQIDYEIFTLTWSGTTTLPMLRGAQGTIEAAHSTGATVRYLGMDNTPWTPSAHPIVVNTGWKYSYAYQSITGQVSDLVDVETNPTLLPSNTGPFVNLIPQVAFIGAADTTNIPYVVFFRTTDGGGTFFQLEVVANPGAGTFTYYDDSAPSGLSGTTFADPLPDEQLNQAIIAPSLTSNAPPPAAHTGQTGVVNVEAGTPFAYYAGRWFFGLGNFVYYSGQEEITLGVPEECFPTGTNGNFFKFQTRVMNLQVTNDGLYIITRDATNILTGTALDTFNLRPLFQDLGAPVGHPRAICRFSDSICWLTHDYRIVLSGGSQLQILSHELGQDLITAINAGNEVDIKTWASLDKQFILVSAINKQSPSLTSTWVFDVLKSNDTQGNFWYAPWTVPTTCLAQGRTQTTSNIHSLIFAVNNGASTYLATYDTTGSTGSDFDPSGASTNFDFIAVTNLFMLPPGNHINALRRPGVIPTVDFIEITRSQYAADKDPDVFAFFDDLWTTPVSMVAPSEPMFTAQTLGYRTLEYPVTRAAKRVALKLQKLASPDKFDLQNITIVFLSTLGN